MSDTENAGEVKAEVAKFRKDIDDLRAEIGKTIIGNKEVVDGASTGIPYIVLEWPITRPYHRSSGVRLAVGVRPVCRHLLAAGLAGRC